MREDEGGTIEIVIHLDDRVKVVESERCVYVARYFEFGTKINDATISREMLSII